MAPTARSRDKARSVSVLTLSQSRIDFALTIEPSAEGLRRLGVLFGLLPHPPDARAYLLSGPLLAPSIS